MAGKTAILAVDILADATNATKTFDEVGKSAGGAADKIESVGGKAGDTATGLSALSGALDAAGFGPLAEGLNLTATAMDAAEGASILFGVAQESLNLSTLKSTASRVLDTAATAASTVASGIARAATATWTAAQWLLNAAMSANPIGLVVALVLLLIGVIVLIATKTTFFQDVWEAVWSTVKSVASAVWSWLVTAATAAWNLLVAGVRIYVGIYVGIFEGIKSAVGAVWEWIKSAAGTALDAILHPIETVRAAFDKVVDAIRSVIDWLGKIKLPKVLTDIGSAIGGILGGKSGAASVGTVAALVSGAPTLRTGGAGTRAATGGSTVVNVLVPESSDPVATARYLRKLLARGANAGVVFGPT